ncbi:type VI secretion system-associated protein TagF [Pseudoxanthomonas sp.]|uniref:type VI secretion system-associated protein TagF n=1 Tax=Pseudoxanthomonas sp. TaxID=1871049 RepID=UPI00261DE05B|nr:type VI secretion system-associated protein TagF [Pseudoxanthomonas sp.]WDS37802.1 MAG: type VI secretion system-associated protein TagF [Pseudoxanthomonas sp.]
MSQHGAGFFGKLPCAGDFLQRRLPPSFVEPWDGHLSGLLAGAKECHGPSWTQAYAIGPLLAFVLAPGVCGAAGWAGVTAPATDRVGRMFPMTVAAVPAQGHADAGWFTGAALLLTEALANPALDLDGFDRRVLALGQPRHPLPVSGGLWWPVLPAAERGPQFLLEGLPSLPIYLDWHKAVAAPAVGHDDITERIA